jgi:integrase
MSITVAAALGQWLDYREKLVELSLLAESTHGNQGQIAGTIGRSELGTIELSDMRKSHVEIYVGERLQTCEPITVWGEVNVLRQMLNWSVDEQLLAAKPRLPVVKVPDVEQALPADEAFLWVLRWIPEKHSRALEFMMLMGLSPHELERLQVRDEYGGSIGIGQRADFNPRRGPAVKQPSRRRWVPMNERAALLWTQASIGMLQDTQPFPSVDAMEKAIQRLRIAPVATTGGTYCPADVEKITPKMMRSWFASQLAAGDVPEHVLQRLLGHKKGSPITRKHYVRSSDSQLADATAALRA